LSNTEDNTMDTGLWSTTFMKRIYRQAYIFSRDIHLRF
jgi:hypothetical protein